jgi:hypothetical protein
MGEPVGWRANAAEEEKKGEAARKRGHKAALGAANWSEKQGKSDSQDRSRCGQAERGSKAGRNAEQLDGDWARCLWTCIPSEPLFPRETNVRALRAGQDPVRWGWRSSTGRRQADLDVLLSGEVHAGAPVFSAAPIAPEQRRRTNLERMQQQTDATRFGRGVSMPLTLLAQWAVATVADAGAVEDAQTAIRFVALLGGTQRLALWTQQHAAGLEREILSREPSRFPGQGERRLLIALCRSWLCSGRGDSGSKFGGAQRRRSEDMTQFETEIPHPLTDHLPDFLPGGRVTAPAVGILLLVFVS